MGVVMVWWCGMVGVLVCGYGSGEGWMMLGWESSLTGCPVAPKTISPAISTSLYCMGNQHLITYNIEPNDT